MRASQNLQLDYEPVTLAFGTSGLRGLVKDITDLEAYINVQGALRFLVAAGDRRAAGGVVLAGDLRPSTERILGACARAITDFGWTVEYAGRIPTPALILHAMATGRPGVMVTGSHIPFDRNGIKVNKSAGEVLKSDEAGITREVERVRAEQYARSSADSAFDAQGRLKLPSVLPPVNAAAEERYVRRYLDAFPAGALDGLRVLVYQHSAVGRDLLARVLRELGAEVTPVGRSETFIPIDTENVTDEQLDRIEGFVAEVERAGIGGASDRAPLFAVVSTDGDSDRPLVTAVLTADEMETASVDAARRPRRRVRFLAGDLLGLVVAEELQADAAVIPISANDAVERRMKERGAQLEKCRIGSPHVIASMDALRGKRTPPARLVGWEANGGFLVGNDLAIAGAATLAALPTRDALLPILVNLYAAKKAGLSLSALWSRLPARFGRAGLLDEFPVAASQDLLARLCPRGSIVEVELDGDRVLDRSRPGAPPALVSGPAADEWRACRALIERFFTPADHFDEVHRINVLDGVRVYFRSGDVAHLRPSGNAPQLRAYAGSDSQSRADAIVDRVLGEPDGIVRKMQAALASPRR